MNSQQMQNELAGYQHSVVPPDFAMRKQTYFDEIPQYRQILDSLEAFISQFDEKEQ